MIKYLFILFLFVYQYSFGWNYTELNELQKVINIGKNNSIEKQFTKLIYHTKKSNPFKIELYHLYGDYLNDKGDYDEAWIFWNKSNQLRSKLYQKNNYQKAWIYALKAYYNYQKIEKENLKIYTDSCSYFLSKSTNIENKPDIYKIWNILAQAKKQLITYHPKIVDLYTKEIQPYYLKSITYLEKKGNSFDLAITYHLLANSYTDLINASKNNSQASAFLNSAELYYDKSILMISEIYKTNYHYQIARSLFVKGLVNYYYNSTSLNQKILNLYESAIGIYDSIDIVEHPSQSLMCISLYQKQLMKNLYDNYNYEYLKKHENSSQIALKIWTRTFENFKSNNTSLQFSIYGINPYLQIIEIETYKRKMGLAYSTEKIFFSMTQLKYIDYIKWQNKSIKKELVNTSFIKRNLKKNEIFCDFFINDKTNFFIVIDKKNITFFDFPSSLKNNCKSMIEAINSFDYDEYIQQSDTIFQTLHFDAEIIKKVDKITICPDGWLTLFPFETLLNTNKNVQSKDYRKLDYLILSKEINYVLYPTNFSKKIANFAWDINLFAPENKQYSPLPFSKQLVEKFNHTNEDYCFQTSKSSIINNNSTILHLSTHGIFDSDFQTIKLVLTNDFLQPIDIYQSDVKSKLVVLNSCNSGKGKIRKGDGVDGFLRAYLMKNTLNVLSNSWEVDDQTSNKLLLEFYKNLKTGTPSTKSLREAKINQISSAPSSIAAAPYYWAAPLLYGNEITFSNNEDFNFYYYFLFLIPLLFFHKIKKASKK